MKEIQIYLAGKMSGLSYKEQNEYRVIIKRQLEQAAKWGGVKTRVINPVDYYNFANPLHQSESEIMDYDLARVEESKLIIVNIDGLNTSDGSKIEVYDAWKHKIPVIAYDEKGLYEELHPWTKRCITRVEPTLDSLIEYVRNFYFS